MIEKNELQLIKDAISNKNYVFAERLAIEVIKKYPFDEQALLLLGESLLNQGYGKMAQLVYKRASLFHPQAGWVEKINEELQKVPLGERKRNIEELMRVKQITSIAAAILTKNEARCIHRCISSILDAVDEIVVIDTGSTDHTIDIAKSFSNVKVVHFTWCDDFSAARNFGLSQIESRWVFWIDADEYLHPEDIPLVREVASLLDRHEPIPLVHPVLLNKIGHSVSVSYNVPRIFPMRGNLRYYGRIHEQIGPVEGNKYTDMYTNDFFVRIRLFHDGYDQESVNINKKIERNIRLLDQMVKEEPHDPTWWLYLGREVMSRGDTEKAIPLLLKAEQIAQSTTGFGALLEIQRLILQGYLSKNMYNDAEEVCNRMIITDSSFPDTYYYLAYIQMEKARELLGNVEINIQKAKDTFKAYHGLVSPHNEIFDWKADLLLANLMGMTGRLSAAKNKYLEVLNRAPLYKKAIENQLELIKREAEKVIH